MYKAHSKIISVILAVMLVVSMCCLSAGAADDGYATIKTPSGTVIANVGDKVTVNYWFYVPKTYGTPDPDVQGDIGAPMKTNGFQAYMSFDNTMVKPSADTWTALGLKEGSVVVDTDMPGYDPTKIFPAGYTMDAILGGAATIYSIILDMAEPTHSGKGNSEVQLAISSAQSGFADLSKDGGVKIMSVEFEVLKAGETSIDCDMPEGHFFDKGAPASDHYFTPLPEYDVPPANPPIYHEEGTQATVTSDVLVNGEETEVKHDNGAGVFNDNQEPFGDAPEPTPPTEPDTEPQTDPQTDPQTEPKTDPQTEPDTEPAPTADWYVVGVAELCNGQNWVTGAAENKMTFNPETGLYEITFSQVGEGATEENPFNFQFKVSSCTEGSWDNGDSYPDANINGYLKAQDDVKVTYNPTTHEVLWYSDSAFTPSNHTYIVAGSTDLCGSNYDPTDEKNSMTYNEATKRWEKVYENLPKNDVSGYKFKITMDGATWIPGGMGNDQIFYTNNESTTVTIWYDDVTGLWGVDGDNIETEFKDYPTEPQTEPETEPQTEPKTDPQTEPQTEPKTDPQTEPDTEPQTEPQTEPETEPQTEPETEPSTGFVDPGETWYVVGVADLCNGENWVTGAEVNKMTFNAETGLYEITFSQVGEGATEENPFNFQFKVSSCTEGSWDNGDSYPDANINGYLKAQDDVKVTYNPTTHEVLWYSDSAFTPSNHTYIVAGSTDLCGSNYDPTDEKNSMTYNEATKRWEKVYENLPKNDVSGYKFKITMDGATWIPGGMGNDQIVYTNNEKTTITIWYDDVTGLWGVDGDNIETEFKDYPTEPQTEPETEPQTEPDTEPQTEPQTDPDTEPQTEPKTDPQTEPDTEPQTEPKTEPQTEPDTEPDTEPSTGYVDPGETWYVVGQGALCNGEDWVTGAEVNKMTFNTETGLYEITFEQVGEGATEDAPFAFQFKVSSCTEGSWDNGDSYPDANITGYISAQDDVKVTYNPTTHEVKWESASAFTPANHTYRVAGSTDLCGSNYDPQDDNNSMTYNEATKRWEMVYENLPKNDVGGYKFKITMDGATWIPDGMGNDQIVYTNNEKTTITIWYDDVTGIWGVDGENIEVMLGNPPTSPEDQPTTPDTEPGTDTSEPSTDTSEPSTDTSEPSTDTSEPSTDTSEPSTDTSEPSTDTSEPSTDTSEPSTDTSEPSTDTSEPSTDTSEPSTDTSEPSTDASEPSTDVSEPSTDASEPGTDASEPGTDTSEPTTDASETPSETSTETQPATSAGGSGGGSTTGGGSSTTGGGSSTTTSGGSTTGKVATGDSTNIAMLLLILAAAAGVVVFARKRVKED